MFCPQFLHAACRCWALFPSRGAQDQVRADVLMVVWPQGRQANACTTWPSTIYYCIVFPRVVLHRQMQSDVLGLTATWNVVGIWNKWVNYSASQLEEKSTLSTGITRPPKDSASISGSGTMMPLMGLKVISWLNLAGVFPCLPTSF